MFSHVVLFRFENADHAVEARRRLAALDEKVPSLRGIELGLHEGDDPRAWNLCLITRFDDRDGFLAYRHHPDHQEVVSWLKTVITSAAVVDWTS